MPFEPSVEARFVRNVLYLQQHVPERLDQVCASGVTMWRRTTTRSHPEKIPQPPESPLIAD
jgi:hypothetical protein